MADLELRTAKYFEQIEQERAAATAAAEAARAEELANAPPPKLSRGDLWALATSRLSAGLAIALFVSVTVLAVPFFKTTHSRKSYSAIDWLMWMDGDKSDRPFETRLLDQIEASSRELDALTRESPAFQFDAQTNLNLQFSQPFNPGTMPSSPPVKSRRSR